MANGKGYLSRDSQNSADERRMDDYGRSATKVGTRMLYVDLGIEKLFAADKDGRRIAVEVKSFLGPSLVKDLEQALGQYIMYSQVLSRQYSECMLYLAITQNVFSEFFSEELPQLMIELNHIKLLVFDPEAKEVIQ